ncbi:MAG: DNA methyltransferase [Mesotoga sp.]|nr:DNA methyltransferase [Mesotoga sp.]
MPGESGPIFLNIVKRGNIMQKPKGYADGIPVWCSFDEIVPVVSLIDNPKNPNHHPEAQIKKGAKIIKGNGWRQAIVISKRSGWITKGHGRKLFAIEAGVSEVPVDYQDYESEAAEWADVLADNELALEAEIDLVEVKDILDSIPDIDVDLTGYNIDQLMADIEAQGLGEETDAPEDPGARIDRAEELQHEWKTEYGQVWEIPSKTSPGKAHRLMCGDSTKEDEVKKLLAGNVPFIMVTDPPYGVEYDPDWRNKAAAEGHLSYGARAIGKVKNDDIADWSAAWNLFPGSVVYTWSPGGDHVLITGKALVDCGFSIRSMIIWKKAHFAISRGAYHYQHEPCWYAVRKGAKSLWCGDRSQSTVWDIDHVKNETGHGTQKPLECMARPIRNHGGKDDDVYDPFLGSGTTMIAAERSDRICFGMEIDPKYCAVILQRCLDMGLEPKLT